MDCGERKIDARANLRALVFLSFHHPSPKWETTRSVKKERNEMQITKENFAGIPWNFFAGCLSSPNNNETTPSSPTP